MASQSQYLKKIALSLNIFVYLLFCVFFIYFQNRNNIVCFLSVLRNHFALYLPRRRTQRDSQFNFIKEFDDLSPKYSTLFCIINFIRTLLEKKIFYKAGHLFEVV